MKTKKYILFLTIVLISLTVVMPFNIIHGDSAYFAGIHLFTGSDDYVDVSDGNSYRYLSVLNNTSDVYLVGYNYQYNSSTRRFNFRMFSNNSFTMKKYDSNQSSQGTEVSGNYTFNGNTFKYTSDYANNSINYDNGFPLIDTSDYQFSTNGLLYEYLKASNQLSVVNPLVKINAGEPFYSWRTDDPSQPYIIESSSDAYVIGSSTGSDIKFYILTDDEDATVTCTRGQSQISLTKGVTYVNGSKIVTYLHTQWNINSSYHYNFNINTSQANEPLDIPLALFYDEVYDVAPPVNYGDLQINFYTKYAGSGGSDDLTWRENQDVIQWSLLDTNGFNIADYGLIELRAVPGSYVASSYASLITQGINDFILENFSELSQRSYLLNPYDQEYKRKWGNIVDNYIIDIPFFNLYAYTVNDSWYKNGWVWQARIVDFEDPTVPITEWQTVYNSTSFSGNDGLNNPTLNPDAYDTFQEINNINNITNNTWYINNAPVGVDTNTPTSDGTWIEKLIESITDLIGTIVENITKLINAILGIGSDIIEGLFNLINDLGVNLISFFRDLIDSLTGADEQIDLTLPEWDPIAEDNGILDEFKALGNGFVNIFINSGLGYMLIIPLIIILLRLVF